MDNLQGVATPVQILMFERNGWVPNNPHLPVKLQQQLADAAAGR